MKKEVVNYKVKTMYLIGSNRRHYIYTGRKRTRNKPSNNPNGVRFVASNDSI